MAGRPSGFKTAAARAQYCALYDESIAQSPFPVEESDILTSFGTTHVLTAGDATMPPLVALHAMGFGSTMWLPLLPSLTPTHCVRMLDAVGGANKSMATGVIASAEDVVTWIDVVLDRLAIGHCQVVGASIGAWMAANYAMARPDRVARLALLAPAGMVGALRTKWLVTMTVKSAIRPTPAKTEWLLDTLVKETTRPRLRADPWRPIAQQFVVGMTHIRRNMRELRPGIRCSIDRLAASDIPVLILVPRDETGHDGPTMVRRYTQQLPSARVELVDNANHLIFIDRTDIVCDELRKFLAS